MRRKEIRYTTADEALIDAIERGAAHHGGIAETAYVKLAVANQLKADGLFPSQTTETAR